jgi:hypothetical protein
MITAATGVKAYFIGKPNPLMMRSALRQLGVHSEDTVMVKETSSSILDGPPISRSAAHEPAK